MNTVIKQPPQNSRLILEEMEPRRLFSGGLEGLSPSGPEYLTDPLIRDLDAYRSQSTAGTDDATAQAEQQSREIVFIDAGVDNFQQFVDDLEANQDTNRNIEVVVLDRDRDGIEQISAVLQDRDSIDAVHIISHGSDGSVQLGNSSLNAGTLAENNSGIALWANAFNDSGDILIYGCDLAASEVGQNLITQLANLTLTDVAASNDATGHESLGGDWDLEYHAGEIDAEVAPGAGLQARYQHILAVINGTAGDDVLMGTAASDVISADAGNDVLVSGGGSDQLLGEAGTDVFRFTNAQDGDVITVDGGGETDTIDLSEFGSGTVTDDGSTITVNLGNGMSFTINYSNIENLITADTAGNHGPDADAGRDQSVAENTVVTLQGALSDDFDGDALTYSWVQTGGPAVTLSNTTIAQPTFTSPSVASETVLAFSMVVSDGTTSHIDVVEIRVLPSTSGNNGPNTMTGTAGGDWLDGSGGADTINGGDGDDVLRGGSGNDVLNGGVGIDIADYGDAPGAILLDLTDTNAQNTGAQGTDTLSGIEGVTGSAFNDTFSFSNPQDGAVYSVDGNSGTNTIDLSNFASTDVTFGDGSITIDMGGGQSFTIDYDRVNLIDFSDITATVLTGDESQAGWSGSGLWIDGAEAFRVDMTGAGTIDIAYDKGSDTFSVTGATGTNATSSLTITDLNGTDLRVDQITLDTSFGDLTTNTGIGNISLAGTSSNLEGTFTIGGTLGSIDMYDLAGTLDVQGNLGIIHIVNDLDPGALLNVTGDVTTLLVDDDIGGTVTIGGDVTTFDLTGVRGPGNVQVTADVTVSGSIGTLHIDAGMLGAFAIGGDLGTFTATDLDSDMTVVGDVDSVTLASVDPAATFTANHVVGTLVFDVGGTDHGGTYESTTTFVFDGSTGTATTTIIGPTAADDTVAIDENTTNGTTLTTVSATGATEGQYAEMYWADKVANAIYKANADGTGGTTTVVSGLNAPVGVEVDYNGGKLYWTTNVAGNASLIQSANLDGTGLTTLVTGLTDPDSIALDLTNGKMYWTDDDSGEIRRANLDGSAIEIVLSGLTNPESVALDVDGGKMYWTDHGDLKIQRANLDGTGIEDLVTTGLSNVGDVELDLDNGKMYWIDGATQKIQRANLDGTGVEDLVTSGLNDAYYLALDVPAGKMYWTDDGDNIVQRANLDGTGIEDLVTTGVDDPRDIALSAPATLAGPLFYSITAGNTGNAFAIDANSGEITVADSNALDFETTPVFNLTVEVQDTVTLLTDTATITINLADVNDAPVANADDSHLVFDGTDIVRIADDASLQMVDTVTMEAWFNLDNSATGSQIILNKEGEYELGVDADTGEIKFAIAEADNTWDWHGSGYIINTDEWIHVAVSYDGIAGEAKTYVNGQLVDTYAQSGNIGDVYPGFNDLTIGGRGNDADERFQGQIDDVRVWDTARSEAEIETNFSDVLAGSEPGLAGYWRLDDAASGQVSDLTGNGNDGVLGGSEGAGSTPVVDGYTTDEDTVLTIPVGQGVLANDFDLEDDPLTVTNLDTSALLGSLAMNAADGSFSYDPRGVFDYLGAGEIAYDTFTYTANDGTSDSNVATVTITVTGTDDGSVISGDIGYTGDEGDTVEGTLSATDAEGLTDTTYFTVTSPATNGTAVIDAETGAWSFTPTDTNWFGSDSFEVTVTDDLGGTTTQVVSITLANVDDPAIISGDISYVGNEGDAVGGDMDAADVEGLTDGSYFTVTADATNGSAAIDPATGVWTFTPTDPNWFGSDSFTVTVTDDLEGTTTQVVNITLAPVDDPAVISGDISFNGDQTEPVFGTLLATDVDGLSDGDYFAVTSQTSNGTAAIDAATGAWTFTPTDPNWFGVDSFTVTVTDDAGGTTTQVVSIEVDTNATQAIDDDYSVGEDATLNSEDLWIDTDWLYRRTLSFDNSSRTEDLVDFPILVKLDSSVIDYSKTHDSGADLRFYDQDGTMLAHEIEVWDESGASYIWVSVPQINANSDSDSIVMYYGNAGVASDAQNAAALWSNFTANYHMNEDPGDGGTVVNSVGVNDAINYGSTDTVGIIGNGQSFDGVDDYMDLGNDKPWLNNATGATLSIWMNPDDLSGHHDMLGFTINEGGTSSSSRFTLIQRDDEIRLIGRTMDDGSDVVTVQTNSSPLTAGQWHHVTGTIDYGSDVDNIKIYVNGVLEGTFSHDFTLDAIPDTNSDNSAIGANEGGGGDHYAGKLDEARIMIGVLSEQAVEAQYAGMIIDFVNIGFEQTVEGVLINDFDREGDAISVIEMNGDPGAIGVATTLPSGAIITLNADGSFFYDTNGVYDWVSLGATTTDSFDYRIDDGNGNVHNATVTITIVGSNDSPVAVDDAVGTTENAILNASVPAASDVDGVISSYALGGTNVAQGSLVFNGDGSYSFDPGTDFDDLAVGEIRAVSFTYIAIDNDGGASAEQTVIITVTGTNDAPTISDVADIAFVENTDASAQNLTASGTVNFDDVDSTDLVDISTTLTTAAAWSNGTLDATLKAQLEAGFSAAVIGAAAPGSTAWSFTVNNTDLDFLASGETITLTFTITATDSQAATASDTVSITITGSNDAPVITDGPDSANLVETDAGLVTNGDLTIGDLDTRNQVTAAIDSLVVSGTSDRGDAAAPSDAALLAMLNINPAAILDGTQNTNTLTWTFDSGTEAFDYLATGETLILQYTISATDDDGTPLNDTETVTITLTGSNDAPVITGGPDTASLAETNAALNTTGNLTVTDVDTTDVVTASVSNLLVSGTSDRGDAAAPSDATLLAMLSVSPTTILNATQNTNTLTWTFDSGTEAFDYLAAGETLILQYTISATDDDGTPLSDTETVTITITGSNDAPVITGGPDTAGLTETNAALNTAGTLIIGDVDTTDVVTAAIDSLVVSGTSDRGDAAAPSDAALLAMLDINPTAILDGTQNTNTLTWTFDSGTEAFDYLAAGETLILQYTISATDDDGTPLNDTETVTITITGSNDAPVITGGPDTASLVETNAALNATGNLTVTDVDTTDVVTASVSNLLVSGTSNRGDAAAPSDATLLAMLSVSPTTILNATQNTNTLTWTFDSGTEAFEYLAAGETLILQYTISATDDDGTPLSDTETVTITITGSNDAPVITGGPDTAGLAETNAALNATGNLTVTDVDTTDVVTASVSNLLVSGTSDRGDAAAPSDATLLAMLSVSPTTILDGTQNTSTLTWTFDSGTEAFDYLAAGETLILQYTVQVIDDDGTPLNDTETVTITITGSNDAPIISGGPDTAALTETNAALNAAGTFTITDVNTTDVVTAAIDSLVVSGSSDRSDAAAPSDAALLAMLNINPTAILDGTQNTNTLTWTFDSGTEAFDYLATGETLILQYTISATDDDGTPLNDTETVTITITGSNDAPIISGGPGTVGLTETNAALNAAGTFTVTDVNTTDVVTASVNSLVVSGTSDRSDAAAPSDATLLTMLSVSPVTILNGTQNTNTLTWTFDSGTEAFDYLATGETLILQYTVQVIDDDGTPLSDTETVTITITGSNDAPIISGGPDTAALTETNAALNATGNLTVGDVDTTDVITASINGLIITGTSDRTDAAAPSDAVLLAMLNINPTAILDGTQNTNTLTWTFDSGTEAFEYLAAGETLVLQYTVQVIDDDGTPLNDTETVTITITGSNDAPVITGGPDTVSLTETNAGLNTTGTLTVDDVDTTDVVTASVNALVVSGTSDRGDAAAPSDATLLAMLNVTPITILNGTQNTNTLTWTFDSGTEAFDYLATGETLILQYTVQVIDDDGTPLNDTETVTITITGSNDAPVITGGPDTAGLVETNAALNATGNLTVTDVDTTDVVTASANALVVSGTSDRGDAAAPSDATLLAMLSVSPTTILDGTQNTSTLTWTFDSGTEAFDYLATGETLILQYTVQVIDDDGTPLSDTETVTITITGSNDAPVITGGPDTASLAETNAALNATGNLTVTDVDTTDVVTASVNALVVSGTSDRSDAAAPSDAALLAMMNVTPTTILNATQNTNTLTWTFDSGTESFDYLTAGDTLVLQYTVQAIDDDGTPLNDTEAVTITITGSNDAPVITGGPDTAGLTETNAALNTSGSLTISDTDTTDVVTAAIDSLVVSGTSDRGDAAAPSDAALLAMLNINPTAILDGTQNTNTLTWTFDSGTEAFDYLAAGETLVLQYTISATDDDGTPLSDTETVTITITGSNDAPIITGGPDTAGLTETNAALNTTGTLTVDDVDTIDVVTATVDSILVSGTSDRSDPAAPSDATLLAMLSVSPATILNSTQNTNSLAWTFDSGSEAFDYLAVGETLVLQYTVQVIDDDGTPLNDTETVTITITGSNDAPVAVDAFVGTDENTAVNGSVPAASDVDGTVVSYALGGTSVTEGSLSFNADGSYRFDPGTDFDDLAAGSSRSVTFTYTAIDNDGAASAEQTVTITVIGSNDAPIIGGIITGSVTEDINVQSGRLVTQGSLTITDPDAGQSAFQPATINGSYGSLSIDAAGNWSYSTDNTQPQIQSLRINQSLVETLTVTTVDGTRFNVVVNINGTEDPETVVDPSDPPPPAGDDPPPDTTDTKTDDAGVDDVQTILAVGEVEDVYTIPQSRQVTSRGLEGEDHSALIDIDYLGEAVNNQRMQDLAQPREISAVDTSIDNLSFQFSDDEAVNERYENALLQRLDLMQAGMDSDLQNRNADSIKVQIVMGTSTTLTAGIVSWVLRGGSLLASLMSTVPLLRRFDPLPILKSRSDEEDVAPDEDDETEITGAVGENQRRVENLFSRKAADHQAGGDVNE